MKNTVKKMFDLTLYDSVRYFPDHATNPEKFWTIISEYEESNKVSVDLEALIEAPSTKQLKRAREFNAAFQRLIVKNPTKNIFITGLPADKVELEKLRREFSKFEEDVKALFRDAFIDIVHP
mgnify:CR=1 FL=1